MSTRLSPDGMYYWDGQQWVSTLSHDGRTRWNGTQWVPTSQAAYGPASFQQPAHTLREPTSWTRPLQYCVAGLYTAEALYSLTLPFWFTGAMSSIMNQAIQRSEQRNPTATPPPADFVNGMTSFMNGAIWFAVVIGLMFFGLIILGALKRWTWMYYVVLVLLGLGAISLPLNATNVIGGPALSSASGFTMPSWTYWTSFLFSIPGTALFVWMVVALAKRGPWAMRKVAPQTS